jgi:hypothetical protein
MDIANADGGAANDDGISAREGVPMSITRARVSERDEAASGELDEVALLTVVDGWNIGTTGTVVAASSTHRTIEILGYFGESLGFLDVPTEQLRLVWKCPEPDLDFARSRAREGAEKKGMPLPIGEHDVVALRTAIDGWPAGTTGTVIYEDSGFKQVEIANHRGEDLAFLTVAPEELRVVWRTAHRGHEPALD